SQQQRHPQYPLFPYTTLFRSKKGSDRVRIIRCISGYQEGELVAHALKELQQTPHKPTCALVYRAHYQSRTLEEALIRSSIPYTLDRKSTRLNSSHRTISYAVF